MDDIKLHAFCWTLNCVMSHEVNHIRSPLGHETWTFEA